jgi:hypothetical protein
MEEDTPHRSMPIKWDGIVSRKKILMAINFVGDNDHGDKVLPLSDLLWEEVTKLRQEVVRLNNVINELKSLDERNEYVKNSYQKILDKHHDIFLKLAEKEKTNG